MARSAPLILVGALLALGGLAAAFDRPKPRRQLAKVSLGELQALAPETRAVLRRALRREGAVLLTDVPGLDEAATAALAAASDCMSSAENLAVHPDLAATVGGARGPVVSRLPGRTFRWTVATQTRTGIPEPLPEWAGRDCPAFAKSSTAMRSVVGLLVMLFARSVDSVSSPVAQMQAGAPLGFALGSLEEVVRRGALLEHFHRYVHPPVVGADSPSDDAPALEMHTDAGMLQALAVRWRSAPGAGDLAAEALGAGLEIELPDGEAVSGEHRGAAASDGALGGSGLLFMVGQGGEEWLPHLGLRAAPHAVSLQGARGVERLVFGAMVLPPEDWVIVPNNVTFGEWWGHAQRAVADFAPASAEQDPTFVGCLSTPLLHRRLADLANACPAGSMYCWMACRSVEGLACDAEHAVCVSDTTGEVCPESMTAHDASCMPRCPSSDGKLVEVFGAGESSEAVKCDGFYKADEVVGGKFSYLRSMENSSEPRARIQWDAAYQRWELFVPGYKDGGVLYFNEGASERPPTGGWESFSGDAPAPRLRYPHSGSDSTDGGADTGNSGEFCNGVLTDMHMLGFTFARPTVPCLIYLFPGWELTDSGKFWGSVVVTVLAGIFAEFLIFARRKESELSKRVQAHSSKSWNRLSVLSRLLLYAMTRTMGYLIMLVSMMYSYEMFMALILGLTLGHGFFNLSAPPGEDATPCCQAGGSQACSCTGSASGFDEGVLPGAADTSLAESAGAGMLGKACEGTVPVRSCCASSKEPKPGKTTV